MGQGPRHGVRGRRGALRRLRGFTGLRGRSFRRSEDGSVTIETVAWFPVFLGIRQRLDPGEAAYVGVPITNLFGTSNRNLDTGASLNSAQRLLRGPLRNARQCSNHSPLTQLTGFSSHTRVNGPLRARAR